MIRNNRKIRNKKINGKYQRDRQFKKNLPTPNTDSRLGTHPETGWHVVQSQYQFFIIFTMDAFGFELHPDDVLAAFSWGQPIGWGYVGDGGQLGNSATIPIMMREPNITLGGYLTEQQCLGECGTYSNGVCVIPICNPGTCPPSGGTCEYPTNNSSFCFGDSMHSQALMHWNSQTGEISALIKPDDYQNCLNVINGQVYIIDNSDGLWTLQSEHFVDIDLDFGANLISMPYYLSDSTPTSLFGTQGPIYKIVGQGEIANLVNGTWVGPLTNINPLSGYWVITDAPTTIEFSAHRIDNPIYELNPGATLISYPNPTSMSVEDAIDSETHLYIDAFIGDGVGLVYHGDYYGWVGSLDRFRPNKGYWVRQIVDGYNDFEYGSRGAPANFTYFDFAWPSDSDTMDINTLIGNLKGQINQIGHRPRRRR